MKLNRQILNFICLVSMLIQPFSLINTIFYTSSTCKELRKLRRAEL